MTNGTHRLYVFGVTFAALFLLGFLLTAMFAADLNPPARIERPVAIGDATVDDSTDGARQSALSDYRSARAEVSRARDKSNVAELDLFRFLHEQTLTPAQTIVIRRVETPIVVAPVKPTPNQQPAAVDRQAAKLERDLAAAQQHKTELLERLTPAHPAVQSLDSTIAELTEQLEAARRATSSEPPATAPQVPEAQIPAAEPAPFETREVKTVARPSDKELMIAAGRAKRDYEAALETERTCWTEYSRLASVAVVSRSAPVFVAPAAPPTPRPLTAIGVLLTLAAGGGLIAARAARRPAPTFQTAAEVESTLGLPVLGSLAFAGGAVPSATWISRAEPSWVRRSVTVCELVLAVAIGSLVVLAIVDLPFVRQMLADPLSEITAGIVKIRTLAGK